MKKYTIIILFFIVLVPFLGCKNDKSTTDSSTLKYAGSYDSSYEQKKATSFNISFDTKPYSSSGLGYAIITEHSDKVGICVSAEPRNSQAFNLKIWFTGDLSDGEKSNCTFKIYNPTDKIVYEDTDNSNKITIAKNANGTYKITTTTNIDVATKDITITEIIAAKVN